MQLAYFYIRQFYILEGYILLYQCSGELSSFFTLIIIMKKRKEKFSPNFKTALLDLPPDISLTIGQGEIKFVLKTVYKRFDKVEILHSNFSSH